ncbi:hypothetical protein HDU87_005261 [Geranomyces variabilis]|uniref:WH2 domain-containing protein n=1 Tax=Geranomyces variabilis TaxID=109894 RepID=A0AAD5TJH8_9FUNG|nr:hypothetical protein HDU87_005261 [Geranomyces variabilis]
MASAAPPAIKPPNLLAAIEKGTKLKKVQTNDRSAALVEAPKGGGGGGGMPGGGRSPPVPRRAGAGGGGSDAPAPMAAPAGLGGLFAGGMPKLRSTGRKGGNDGDNASAPEPPAPKPFMPSSAQPPVPSPFARPNVAPPSRAPAPPSRPTPPPAPSRTSAPPPTPPRATEPDSSPTMPRAPPAVPNRSGPPAVPDRGPTVVSPPPAPPTQSRFGTFPKTNGAPAAPARAAPPPPPASRGPPPPPPARAKDTFEKPASPATANRPTPPPFGGLKSSTSIGAAGFAAARGGSFTSSLRPSNSANGISALANRRESDAAQQTETDGRWTFRTDLPAPRQLSVGNLASGANAAPHLPPSRASTTGSGGGFGSPAMGRRPPPPPPPSSSRRASAFPPPPPPPRSREGSVGQAAEIVRYVDETVPKLEQELVRCVANAEYMKCASLKGMTDQLCNLKKRAESGGSVVMLMDDFRRMRSEADHML